ncbi:ArsR/SmtB family transcription factor [Planotetraspora phitsanulokensis]|uniref:Transcriptional regulator n=1 Tax=Planotetraspora phitsanulokensis TaxID=575192 RepID=A0A8J3XHJ1_9ACTN|nr:winged helix-turn-helix domain-containing protein [Planotetraspora phitsanulokensis]GII42022.1 transcriptional regulator [Planotetraspora phitsanulokensis]
MEDESPEQEQLVLRSPAQFRALGHPVRHRLVNLLRQRPATLAQLTAALGSTKGTIGYHVRILREAGLVRLASTRQVRGGTEQYFALVSRGFKLGEDAEVGPEFLINAALAEMLPPGPGQGGRTMLRHLWLTEDEAEALAVRLREYATDPPPSGAPRGEAYGLLVSLYPADIPALSPDEHAGEPG